MNPAILILFYVNFVLIGLLPKIFFKKEGRSLNFMWWVTAAPFILCPLFLTLPFMKLLPPVTGYGASATKFLGFLSIPFGIVSIMLISFTLGTHRILTPFIPYVYRFPCFKQVFKKGQDSKIIDYSFVSMRGVKTAFSISEMACRLARQVSAPTLVIHSKRDRATDFKTSSRFFNKKNTGFV